MKKNIMLYITLAILGVFTLVYFAIANHLSYAFSYDSNTVLYDSKIDYIKSCAENYAKSNPDVFNDKDSLYVTVKDLVDLGYVLPDDENGNVSDPTSDVKLLNDIKLRITNKNNKLSIKVLK